MTKTKKTQLKKKFPIADVLAVTHGIAITTNQLTGIKNLIYFMSRNEFSDDILLMATQSCRKDLFKQHPQLKEISKKDILEAVKGNAEEWLKKISATYGEELTITPLSGKIM